MGQVIYVPEYVWKQKSRVETTGVILVLGSIALVFYFLGNNSYGKR